MNRLAFAIAALAFSSLAWSQACPSRPVHMVVPLSPGGFAAEVQNNFRTGGVEATWMGPQGLAAFMRAEYEKWGRVVRETGATVN